MVQWLSIWFDGWVQWLLMVRRWSYSNWQWFHGFYTEQRWSTHCASFSLFASDPQDGRSLGKGVLVAGSKGAVKGVPSAILLRGSDLELYTCIHVYMHICHDLPMSILEYIHAYIRISTCHVLVIHKSPSNHYRRKHRYLRFSIYSLQLMSKTKTPLAKHWLPISGSHQRWLPIDQPSLRMDKHHWIVVD